MSSPVSGKILKLIDEAHLLLSTKELGKIWLGHRSVFGNLEIGKNISIGPIERFYCEKYVKNPNGNYKLIFLSSPSTSLYLGFLDKKRNVKINVSNLISSNFNNNELGESFDLSLIESYKGINIFNNLKENKSCENVKIRVLNKLSDLHYLCIYDKKQIYLSSECNLDSYIGTVILVDLYKKYLATHLFFGDTYYSLPQKKFTFQLSFVKQPEFVFVTNNNNNFLLLSDTNLIINANNTGKIITTNYIPLKQANLASFKRCDNTKGYELIEIKNDKPLKYIFKSNKNEKNIFSILIASQLQNTELSSNLSNSLGKSFNFTFNDFYILENFSIANDTSAFLLTTTLKSDIYVFTKDNKTYVVDINNFDNFQIAPSLIGRYFDLILAPVYITDWYNDITI